MIPTSKIRLQKMVASVLGTLPQIACPGGSQLPCNEKEFCRQARRSQPSLSSEAFYQLREMEGPPKAHQQLQKQNSSSQGLGGLQTHERS